MPSSTDSCGPIYAGTTHSANDINCDVRTASQKTEYLSFHCSLLQ